MVGRDYAQKKLTFIVPATYLLQDHLFRIHVVLFAQLRPSHSVTSNCMANPLYLVPCMPVKAIDQDNVNIDFTSSLQLMYFQK